MNLMTIRNLKEIDGLALNGRIFFIHFNGYFPNNIKPFISHKFRKLKSRGRDDLNKTNSFYMPRIKRLAGTNKTNMI